MAGVLHQNFINIVTKCGILPSENKPERDKNKLSSLGIKYPTLRDSYLHTGETWLGGKRADDGAEGLWRIHGNLYDFSNFIDIHPGGKDWLELTKGTDITEAFEVHHLSQHPERMLPKHFVRKAKQPRNSPFTFDENGFYKTLKKKIYEKLKTIPNKPADRSKYFTDLLLFSYICSAVLAVYFKSFITGAASGVLLSMTAIAAHNFFHQKDNFRMFYFDFTLMESRGWRITHALSHHLYTNTVNDIEITTGEPFLRYLPTEKNLFVRYLSWVYSPIAYAFAYIKYFLGTVAQIITTGHGFRWTVLLPFSVPILTFVVTQQSPSFCALMFLWIMTVSSFYFGLVGVNAAHHHPDIFHDGDTPRPKEEMDWGVYQLDAVMDRKDITGSHFLVLTNFGDHALHHMFPTVDHGLLEHLYPVFLETCEQFGVQWKLSSQIELTKGQFRQLAKVKPNPVPPKPISKSH